jgi:uncharacterized DUF497 family protein
MTIRLQIDSLEWDDWNLEHIKKHDVSRQEAEEVIQSDYAYKESYSNRILITGRTWAGRVLSIAVGASPDRPGAYYVFSARPAHRKERRVLEEHLS